MANQEPPKGENSQDPSRQETAGGSGIKTSPALSTNSKSTASTTITTTITQTYPSNNPQQQQKQQPQPPFPQTHLHLQARYNHPDKEGRAWYSPDPYLPPLQPLDPFSQRKRKSVWDDRSELQEAPPALPALREEYLLYASPGLRARLERIRLGVVGEGREMRMRRRGS